MSCQRYTSVIVDHACGAEITADAAAHLDGCDACRRMFDEQLRLLQELDAQLTQALAIEPSAPFVPEVMARLEAPADRWRRAMWWSVPVAAAAVLILVAFGALRSGGRPVANRPTPAVQPTVSSAPPVDRTPVAATSTSSPGERARVTESPRVAARLRSAPARPRPVEPDVLVEPDQSRAIARYLTLVRRGALDTSAIVGADRAGAVAPTELVIAPLAVDALAAADVERGLNPGVERRQFEFR